MAVPNSNSAFFSNSINDKVFFTKRTFLSNGYLHTSILIKNGNKQFTFSLHV